MWTHPDFEAVAALFSARTGIPVVPDRAPLVEAGIRRAMSRVHSLGIEQFHARIASEPALLDEVIRELVVGETYFFRDLMHFDFVRRTVLPDIRQRRGARHVVRAWSAACSTGEEPYSLAMVFEEEKVPDRSTILATDISSNALALALRGAYRPWSLRGDGAQGARKYLRPEAGRFVLEEHIKRHVDFRQLNLVADDYPSLTSGVWDMDFIFCRNVLIYFGQDAIELVARKLAASLVEGGYLIPGPSDPLLFAYAPLEPIVTPEGVFYRRKHGLSVDIPVAIVHAAPAPVPVAAPAPAPAPVAAPAPVPVAAPAPAPVAAPALPSTAEDLSLVQAAEEAMRSGDYRRAADLTWDLTLGEAVSVVNVRALANLDLSEAQLACEGALALFPLSTELRYLYATLLVGLGRDGAAEQEARRAIYLDRSLAVGHALLGTLLKRRGDLDSARRSFRNAYRICAANAPDAPVSFGEGENAATMAAAMASELAWIGVTEEPES